MDEFDGVSDGAATQKSEYESKRASQHFIKELSKKKNQKADQYK